MFILKKLGAVLFFASALAACGGERHMDKPEGADDPVRIYISSFAYQMNTVSNIASLKMKVLVLDKNEFKDQFLLRYHLDFGAMKVKHSYTKDKILTDLNCANIECDEFSFSPALHGYLAGAVIKIKKISEGKGRFRIGEILSPENDVIGIKMSVLGKEFSYENHFIGYSLLNPCESVGIYMWGELEACMFTGQKAQTKYSLEDAFGGDRIEKNSNKVARIERGYNFLNLETMMIEMGTYEINFN